MHQTVINLYFFRIYICLNNAFLAFNASAHSSEIFLPTHFRLGSENGNGNGVLNILFVLCMID